MSLVLQSWLIQPYPSRIFSYFHGSTFGSALRDTQTLQTTFSYSLTYFPLLLKYSKSWYADYIYLLTAKIIKDCTNLYIKINSILMKLGEYDKNNWKIQAKFVYKERWIRK